eukprot:197984_1
MAGHLRHYTFNDVNTEHKQRRVYPSTNPNTLHSSNQPKISCQITPNPSHDELRLLQQMGVTHCFAWIPDEQININYLKKLKEKVNSHELILYNIQNYNLSKNIHIILNTKHRNREIQKWKNFIRLLSKLDIHLTIFTWEFLGIVFTTHYNLLRGNTQSRAFDENKLNSLSKYIDTTAKQKLSNLNNGKTRYTEQELWHNMTYFLHHILPYCKKYNVHLALHPNDPPVPIIRSNIYSIPNIIRNKQSYDRVFNIANDIGCGHILGMEFCCGCWWEGGDKFGDIYKSIKEYTINNKICVVHLRNVSATLPNFTETIIDEGYGNIFKIVNILVNNGYNGTIIVDHTPDFVIGEKTTAACFCIGYIKSALNAAQHIKGKSKL